MVAHRGCAEGLSPGLGIPKALSVGGEPEHGTAVFGLLAACGASALDDRRRLISDEFPGAVLAGPDREGAIVNVHARASDQDLGVTEAHIVSMIEAAERPRQRAEA
jgi:hypothetical protein